MITTVLIGAAATVALSWLMFAVALLIARRRADTGAVARLPRMVADTVRLLRRLLADPALPKAARWRVVAAFVYTVQPFNIIPDFVPVIGFVDNVVVIMWALRSVLRSAGPEVITRHWPGSDEDLLALLRVVRLPRREFFADEYLDVEEA